MSITRFASALALLALCAPLARAGDDEGWEKLGEREVAFRAEKDTILAGLQGRFNKVRFHVKGNGVEIFDIKVNFGNGESCDVQVREHIEEGGYTRAIDLPGEARVIKSIELVYKTRGKAREGKATVAAWGKNAGGDAGGGKKEEWVKLGERKVDFAAEKDTIPVGAGDGLFKRIRFAVEENGVEIISIKVRFGNGETEEVTVREHIEAGGQTRVIDLPGALRVIKEIDLVYATRGKLREGKAHLKVFGLKQGGDGEGKPAGGGGGDDDKGWERLGSREVNFRAERDTIEVTAKEGKFKRIRLHVTGNAVEFLDLEVIFGNGDKHDVAIRDTIREGGYTRVIDLPGEARFIKEVRFAYKVAKERAGRGKAEVKLWGKND